MNVNEMIRELQMMKKAKKITGKETVKVCDGYGDSVEMNYIYRQGKEDVFLYYKTKKVHTKKEKTHTGCIGSDGKVRV